MSSTQGVSTYSPIGLFDSGYGGLTILREIRELMPQYDYLYLGDNARAPYGNRSFSLVYEFTWQSVRKLFSMGCQLVILACNTASAKALRSIQQHDLPLYDPSRRVLGVIRPTTEQIGLCTHTNHVGIVATSGTIRSHTYQIEIAKLWPHIQVSGQECPLWAPLVECHEHTSEGADFFVKKNLLQLLEQDPLIDTVILGCTHYPLLLPKIRTHLPSSIHIMEQGPLVAESLQRYLQKHPEMEQRLSKGSNAQFYTTEEPDNFSHYASLFLGQPVEASHLSLL